MSKAALVDGMAMAELQAGMQAALTGVGSQRNKRLGRALIAVFVGVNMIIFYANVRSMMAAGEDELLEYDPPELGRAHMPHGRRPSQEGTPASVAPAGAPATGEFRGAQARVVPGQAVRQLPAVVTLLSDAAEVPVLRRLVGSVHHWHPEVQLLVYLAADLPAEKVSELSSWRGVRVVPVMRVLADLLDDMQLRSLAGERGVLPGLAAGDWPEGGDGPGEAALAAAAGEVDEWYPIVLYHALKAEPAALLLQPWGVLVGWADHVFKALMRDGTFFICPQPQASANQRQETGLVGYSARSPMVSRQLVHQAACALGAPCAEQPLERPEEGAEGEGVAADGEGAEEGDDAVDEGPEVAVASAVGLGGVWEGDGELCHNEADVNIDMGLRHGVGADSLDPDALGLATGDGAEGDGAAQQRSQHMMAKYQCELRLKDGAQLDGEPKFATEPPGSFDVGGQPPIRIALGVPATTKGTQIHSPDELPLLTVMLPSMLATIDTQFTKYQYILYIGYELGDKVLDNPAKLERLRRRLGDLLAGTAVQAKVLRFPAVHSTTTLWNALFHAAAADSAQYFLASHDDTEFTPPAQAGGAHSKLWTDAVVEALQRSPMQVRARRVTRGCVKGCAASKHRDRHVCMREEGVMLR
eukprot:jgi/Tetstr1/442438/TSEL_030562.t1